MPHKDGTLGLDDVKLIEKTCDYLFGVTVMDYAPTDEQKKRARAIIENWNTRLGFGITRGK